MKATLTIRINYRDYIKLRQIVKPHRDESMAKWFERVREFIENDRT